MINYEIDTWSKQAIGFDRLFNIMMNTKGMDSGYPHYDIIKEDEETYILEFALSGFTKDDLKVEVKENHLTIECADGTHSDDTAPEYVYKGIARRSFERKFVLADTLHVEDVTFNDGILRLVLKQEIPEEQKPKRIEIK